jgi:hypothetical protein
MPRHVSEDTISVALKCLRAKEDLPEPEAPIITTKASSGICMFMREILEIYIKILTVDHIKSFCPSWPDGLRFCNITLYNPHKPTDYANDLPCKSLRRLL